MTTELQFVKRKPARKHKRETPNIPKPPRPSPILHLGSWMDVARTLSEPRVRRRNYRACYVILTREDAYTPKP